MHDVFGFPYIFQIKLLVEGTHIVKRIKQLTNLNDNRVYVGINISQLKATDTKGGSCSVYELIQIMDLCLDLSRGISAQQGDHSR